jgi:hypothetical protein
MPHRKTQFSDLDRRRFLRHTWDGVTARLALACCPDANSLPRHRSAITRLR